MGFQTTLNTIAAIVTIAGVVIGIIQYIKSQPNKELAKSFGITAVIVLVILLIARITPVQQANGSGTNTTTTPTSSTAQQGDGITPSPMATLSPSPTSPPTPTPTPLPCTTGANGNWTGWSINGGWTELNGMLLENGQDTSLITPPDSCQPKTANVAVEATISMLTSDNGGGFSINLRDNSSVNGQTGYHVYVELSIVQIGVINGPFLTWNAFASSPEFITYRFVVIGNQLTFFMNGIQIATVADNRFLASGNVSLQDNNAQLQVKSFKIIPL